MLSRSQVFEFKTISSARLPISFGRLRPLRRSTPTSRRFCSSRGPPRAACATRRARSIRSSRSPARKSRQTTSATVLGLVGRDLVLEMVAAVADETPAAAFELAGKAVELGYDLRTVLRELGRAVRDLMVLAVDPSRIDDPEIAAEGERDRMKALSRRFSREDLLRSFDVLAKAEWDIRNTLQPRYHLEMALLRWIHPRKLVPLTELLAGMGEAPRRARQGRAVGTEGGHRLCRRCGREAAACRQHLAACRAAARRHPRAQADRTRSCWRFESRRWRSTTPSWRRLRRSSSGPIA